MGNRPRTHLSAAAITLAGLLSLLPSWGCDKPPEMSAPPPAPKITERSADLIIALLPERNVFEQKKKYLPLQEYLSERLGQTVYFKLLDNYEMIFSELIEEKVDGGFWGSMNGAIAQVRGGVVMLARPVWEDGASTYWGYVYSRADSNLSSDPLSWRGKSIAFVNQATTAGFLFPLSLLRQAGVTEEPSDFFGKAIFSGSHDASILAVYQGEVDLGASKNTIFEEYMRLHPEVRDSLVIHAQSPEVPSNGLGVRPTLPAELQARLKETLLDMDKNPRGREVLAQLGARSFIETTFDDYQPVFEMADKAGINLSEWPLRDTRGARPYR